MKVCAKCNVEKDESEFGPNKRVKNGLNARCYTCKNEDARDYYNRHPELAEKKRKPDGYYTERTAWNSERRRKWQQLNLGADHKSHIKRQFNLSYDRYESMLIAQHMRCKICKRHVSELQRRLSVDHDHNCCPGKTSCGNCIRGLLCDNCNKGIGFLQEEANVIRAAADYLDEYYQGLKL